MTFTTTTFAVFLAIVLPLYYLLQRREQNAMLLIASYVFYGWWDWRFCLLLALSTVVDFFVGRALSSTSQPVARKRLCALSVGLNLAYLGLFKYFNFFVSTATFALKQLGLATGSPALRIALPIGISFYTFQSISYIVDVYHNRREHTDDFVAFALYLSYFPHLVAGPIQRSTQLLPQLVRDRKVNREQIASGSNLMLVGYFKKVAIADAIAPTVNGIFDAPSLRGRMTLLIGIYLFAMQIYCDFSGYTDIARGVSRLMGIELRLNFRQPYLSSNISAFWRRWHISLSDWLRDYLYIPLGGNRHGKANTYRNLFITMLLGGLWHGANWTFVVWGGLHGTYLAVSRALGRERGHEGRGRKVFGMFVTFHLVCLAWVFFRCPDLGTALTYLRGLFRSDHVAPSLLVPFLFYVPLVFLLDVAAAFGDQEQPVSPRWPASARGVSIGLMAVLLIWVGAPSGAPFIYFQF